LGVFTRLTSDWRLRQGQSEGYLHPAIDELRIERDGGLVLCGRLVALLSIGLLASSQVAAGTYNPFIYFRF
jgi:alginate O-acetyltransferase complex protein AlgI